MAAGEAVKVNMLACGDSRILIDDDIVTVYYRKKKDLSVGSRQAKSMCVGGIGNLTDGSPQMTGSAPAS